MNKSAEFFQQHSMYVTTKDVVGKLIPQLFRAETVNVMWHIKTSPKDFLQLKNQLILFYLDTLNQLNTVMIVQVTHLLSKCILHCLLMDINNIVVMMESNKVTLQLRNSTFNIGFDVPIEQKSVDGLVHLITVLKL